MSAAGIPHDGELAGAVVGRALHALEPEEEDRVSEHLRSCAPCRSLLSETHATMAALAHAVADVEPPAGLRERILAAAAAEPARPVPAPETPAPEAAGPPTAPTPRPTPAAPPPATPAPRRRSLAVLALVAVVAGVVVLSARGLVSGPANDARVASADRADQVITSAEARNPDVRHAALLQPGGSVMAVVLDDGTGPRIVPVDVPAIGVDRTFVLWRVAGGQATAVGTFDAAGTFTATGQRPTTGLAQGAYAVSAEPAGPVPPRPSSVVASGPLI
ncbi:anti-sigma factor domain-containing protein [Actinomycetospora soli]|uniref:anti-sigma factor domain-containing protein n=1 Tax=Actinomycetospora soli TaxID=2893887 RepID=UPI001E491F9B|nr:anti-sigma factor [Actinomycetospora soli]MCD2188347.1 anti-sigma factor [Actinomycetospora soli]